MAKKKKNTPQGIDIQKLSLVVAKISVFISSGLYKIFLLCYRQYKVLKTNRELKTFIRIQNKYKVQAVRDEQYQKDVALVRSLDVKDKVCSEMLDKAFLRYMHRQYKVEVT